MMEFEKQLNNYKKNGEWNKIIALIEDNHITNDKATSEKAFAYSMMASNNIPRKNEGSERADIFAHLEYYRKAEELYLEMLARSPQNITYIRSFAYFYWNEYNSYSFLTRESKDNPNFNIKKFAHKNTIRNRALFLHFLAHELDGNDMKTNTRYAKLIYNIFNPYNKTKINNHTEFLTELECFEKIYDINLFNKLNNRVQSFVTPCHYYNNTGKFIESGQYSNAIDLINKNLELYAEMTAEKQNKNKKYYIISLYYYCRWTLDLTGKIPVQSYLPYFKLPFFIEDVSDVYKNEYIIKKHSSPLLQNLWELVQVTKLNLNPSWNDYKAMLDMTADSDIDYNMVRQPYHMYYLIAQYYERFKSPLRDSLAFERMYDFYRYSCECEFTARSNYLRVPEFNECYNSFLKYYSILHENYAENFFKEYPGMKNKKNIKDTIEYISILKTIAEEKFDEAEKKLKPYYDKAKKSINDLKYVKIYNMLMYYKNNEKSNNETKKYKRYLRRMNNTL